MDYSYFAPPAPSYPFLGMPPKPGHPYTPQEEDPHGPIVRDTYQNQNTYHQFDQSFRFEPNSLIHQAQPQSPPQSLHRQSVPNTIHHDSGSSYVADQESYDQAQGRSSSEEKEMLTPAQSRRKEQNRAAQRAFRERKERHVKDLEKKLSSVSAQSNTLLSDNERLKRELEKLATQNEILRATTTPLQQAHHNIPPPPDSPISGPLNYIFTPNADTPAVPHRIVFSPATGERLLAPGPTWDLIQSHELYQRGMLDVGDVLERLKESAMCDGSGPAFAEGAVKRAIEESVRGAGDELI